MQLALRRFRSIRGQSSLIRSDHGTNFVGILSQKSEAVPFDSLKVDVESLGFVWKMTFPYASQFAGVWERKVSSVKQVLYATLAMDHPHRLGQAINRDRTWLSREKLSTLLQGATAIVTGSPQCSISGYLNDPISLSPQHLLTLRDNSVQPLDPTQSSDEHAYGRHR